MSENHKQKISRGENIGNQHSKQNNKKNYTIEVSNLDWNME